MSLSRFLQTCPQALRRRFVERTFPPEALILEQGDPPEGVHILLEGRARVFHLALNGILLLEYLYSDGELFGEIEALTGQPLISSVQAAETCRTLQVARDDFAAWMAADADFGRFISTGLADKLARACLNSAANIAYPLRYRILYFLWNAPQGAAHAVSKADLISGLGSTERSVNRVLKDLAAQGLLEAAGGQVRLHSRAAALQEMRRFE